MNYSQHVNLRKQVTPFWTQHQQRWLLSATTVSCSVYTSSTSNEIEIFILRRYVTFFRKYLKWEFLWFRVKFWECHHQWHCTLQDRVDQSKATLGLGTGVKWWWPMEAKRPWSTDRIRGLGRRQGGLTSMTSPSPAWTGPPGQTWLSPVARTEMLMCGCLVKMENGGLMFEFIYLYQFYISLSF